MHCRNNETILNYGKHMKMSIKCLGFETSTFTHIGQHQTKQVVGKLGCQLVIFVPTGPNGYPPSLHVSAKYTSSITVSWAKLECYKQNGPILGYSVRLYIGTHYMTDMITDSQATSYTIKNLLPCSSNTAFSIAVLNEAGLGDFSPPLSFATQSRTCICMCTHTYSTCTNAHNQSAYTSSNDVTF